MKGTLAEQLAAALGVKAPEEPVRAADNAQSLARTFNADAIREPRPDYGVSDDIKIGDRILTRLSCLNSGEYGRSARANTLSIPTLVVGIYRDQKGRVMALDGFSFTAQTQKNYSGDLRIDTQEVINLTGLIRAGSRICTHSIYTLANKSLRKGGLILDNAGIIGSVSEDIFPDLAVRRAHSLLFNPGLLWWNDVRIHKDWIREGMFLSEIGLPNIISRKPAPDAACFGENGPVCKIRQPSDGHFSRDAMRRYMDFMLVCHEKKIAGSNVEFPRPGTWRHWQEFSGGRLPVYDRPDGTSTPRNG